MLAKRTPVSAEDRIRTYVALPGERFTVSCDCPLRHLSAEPGKGFEPSTFALQKRCSTVELSRPVETGFTLRKNLRFCLAFRRFPPQICEQICGRHSIISKFEAIFLEALIVLRSSMAASFSIFSSRRKDEISDPVIERFGILPGILQVGKLSRSFIKAGGTPLSLFIK